jgi:UDP-glucose 4-epimerase
MARVIVTGGSGFIGSHVVDALVEAGHAVTVLDRRRPATRHPVGHRRIDLLDRRGLVAAMRGADHVFHLAAVSDVNVALREPSRCVATNVLGTSHVLHAALRAGVSRVHLASTVWVYAAAAGVRLDEESPIDANRSVHLYTASKIAAEALCRSHGELYGLRSTILRYGIPYGPRMREALLIPTLVRRALAGEPLRVSGDGRQARCFVHVHDLARGHVAALDEVAANRVYNLDGLHPVTVLEVAERVAEAVGQPTRIEFVPARAGDLDRRETSIERARRELGWEPEIPFAEGLRSTVEWLLDRPVRRLEASG